MNMATLYINARHETILKFSKFSICDCIVDIRHENTTDI